MTKAGLLQEMCENNKGYLFTAEVMDAGISKTYLIKFARENHLERVAQGIYLSENEWPDELFILQKRYTSVVYTGMTALYLHMLVDREYSAVEAAVPAPFNGSRLRGQGIIVHQAKPEIYEMGIMTVETAFGNRVRVYDKERCICEMILRRKQMEAQNFQVAMKGYMSDSGKRLPRLIEYAKKLRIRDEVMKYVEVMV